MPASTSWAIGLMCACGCNQVLLECNHVGCTYSDRMRDELAAGLERGDNDSLDPAKLRAEVRQHRAGRADHHRLQPRRLDHAVRGVCWRIVLTVWLVRLWKSRAVAQPVPSPKLDAEQLDDLRKKARQETEFLMYRTCRIC